MAYSQRQKVKCLTTVTIKDAMFFRKMLLLLVVASITTYHTQAEKIVHVRNQSPFELQFTIPEREVETQEQLELIPTQKVVITQPHDRPTVISLHVPDAVQNLWVSLPCKPDAPYAKVHLQEICVMKDPDTIYDIYTLPETRLSNFLIALFCHGFLDLQKIDAPNASGYRSMRPYESSHRMMCFPVFSKKPKVPMLLANEEVVELTKAFSREYSVFLSTHAV